MRGGGLQVPMRWGKTKVGIDFAGCMHMLEGIERVLVITVTDGIAVWHNEIAKHCAVPWAILHRVDEGVWPAFPPVASDGFANLSPTAPGRWLDWHVINFQSAYKREAIMGRSWVPMPRDDLTDFVTGAPCLVIVDESHHIGTPTAMQSRNIYMLGDLADSRLTMTGTMFHRKPFYVFGQARFIDTFIYGTDWGAYKKRIAVMGGGSGHEVKRYKNLGWMTRQIKPWVYMEKYVPLRDPVVNIIPTPLTGRNLDVYRSMERDSIVKLGRGHKVSADIVLTKHLRCQQIAGGWARTTEGTYKRVGTCKRDIAESRLREYLEQDITKAVIGCRFLPELRDVRDIALKVGFRPIVFHGGLKKGDERTRRIYAFKHTTEPCLFIAQHRSAREAIDLSAASVMMLYSLPEGFLTFDQFRRRIEVYQDKRTLMYDILIAPGTRDEVAWQAMCESQDVATYIVSHPDLVEQIVATNAERKR